jgi:hypothetical protein
MTDNQATLEIRKIREELYYRHLNQTPEEIKNDYQRAIENYEKAIGRPVKIVNLSGKS